MSCDNSKIFLDAYVNNEVFRIFNAPKNLQGKIILRKYKAEPQLSLDYTKIAELILTFF